MEVTPMNAHLMDSFPGLPRVLGKACQHQGESLLEQEPKNYARELEWSLPQYTILPPTGQCQVPGKVSLARRFHSRFYL